LAADNCLQCHQAELETLQASSHPVVACSDCHLGDPTASSRQGAHKGIKSVQDAIANGIGYVPEDRLTQGLFLARSIARNIVAGSYRQVLDRFGLISAEKVRAVVKRWLTNLSIAAPSPEAPVQSLSGGNQQRVVLAKWLATAPRILILNGPTVGVDVGSKAEIHAILRDLARQGIGVIIISDDIPELLHHCDRILLMQRGRIAQEFCAGEISENELAGKLTGA
jgi:simple sugar transport system ATP-binding protein